jgi:thioredoxin reductase
MQGILSRDGMPPAELLTLGRAEAAGYGVELIDDAVLRIDDDFTVHLGSGGALRARRVLVTTGLRDDIPDDIPGVRERWGRDLLHCPYCHGWEVRDQPLGVLGTNPASVLHAQLIRQWSDDVVYFAHEQPPTDSQSAELAARGIRIVHGRVSRLIIEGDRLTGVELDNEVVHRAAVFVRPIMRPHSDNLVAAIGCDLDAAGFAVTDRTGLTTVPGVWAAGNATDPRAQVITAAGQGSAAAIAINNDLIDHDVAIAMRAVRS